ncbi:efflux transporter outer membrane subunit [Bradyrhizobium erythrophlei]|uniref:efflux transporter outer membrane subunit n=1 Tax=Bradyrhizobium erythrophlei TaxID=1437360 RepID=UPI0035EEA84E
MTLPLGGCLLSGDKPEPGLYIPQAYSAGPKNPKAAEAALPSLDWWRSFRSRELTEIIEETLKVNLDIAAAVARIVQADANARIGGAALLPTANLNASASHSRSSQSCAGCGGGASEQNNFSVFLTATYEIDFWGKNRAALLALEETAVASRFDREVVALSTVVATANFYFQVLAAQDRLRVAHNNYESAQRVLNVIQQRAEAGTASPLEIAQQKSLVATQRATIPPLERTLAQFRNGLAILMARTPEQVRIRGGALNSIAVPRVTPGLPSELLTQRPDIREAEAQLAAANANVANARAQLLPSIALAGAGGYQSALLTTLLRPESAFYTLAAGLVQPIFEGGRLLGNVDLQRGKQDELLQTYRKAVISAFSDVDTALTGIRKAAELEQLQRDVVTESRRAFDISETRLREGTIDLLSVLQTQQTLYTAEDQLVQARLTRFQAVVSLYQALGGGWSPKPAEAMNAR